MRRRQQYKSSLFFSLKLLKQDFYTLSFYILYQLAVASFSSRSLHVTLLTYFLLHVYSPNFSKGTTWSLLTLPDSSVRQQAHPWDWRNWSIDKSHQTLVVWQHFSGCFSSPPGCDMIQDNTMTNCTSSSQAGPLSSLISQLLSFLSYWSCSQPTILNFHTVFMFSWSP